MLRVELDGSNVEEIKLFEGDDPQKVVNDFSLKFSLSKQGRDRLLKQVEAQLDEN